MYTLEYRYIGRDVEDGDQIHFEEHWKSWENVKQRFDGLAHNEISHSDWILEEEHPEKHYTLTEIYFCIPDVATIEIKHCHC